jgi:hypothetical protein
MMGIMGRVWAFLFFLSWVGPAVAAEPALLLADPEEPLETAWEHIVFEGATEYSRDTVDGRAAIRARGRDSASGLYREVSYSLGDRPWIQWAWRVERLQPSADIRIKEGQDFAAALYVMFGRPGPLNRDVPVLTYVWTNDSVPVGTVVPCPWHPEIMRHMVLRSGGRLGQWEDERRNVVEDFRRAFGTEPPGDVEMIALFTDNDQTGEPVEALYGAVRALR